MRTLLLLGLFLLSSANGGAAEFSVLGTRLGMTDGQIIQSLPADLKSGATRNIMGALGELPFSAVQISAGSAKCEWARWKEYGKLCLSYSAILAQKGNGFSAVSIALEQYFDRPVSVEAVEKKIVEAFGEPSARVRRPETTFDVHTGLPKTEPIGQWPDGVHISAPPFSLLPMWIWTADLTKLAGATRSALFQGNSNPGRIGTTAPILRAFMNVDRDHVLGLKIVLINPVALDEWNARLIEARVPGEKTPSDQIRLK